MGTTKSVFATQTPERRNHGRAPLPVTAQCIIDGKCHLVTVSDVSQSGLRIKGAPPQRADTLLKLFVPVRRAGVGRQHLCLVEGRVAWHFGNEAGIKFVNPAQETTQELADYVSAITFFNRFGPKTVQNAHWNQV